MFIAHKREDGVCQPLMAHLRNVAAMCADFAAPFGEEARAHRAGMLHDIGKYSAAGQRRMNDPVRAPKVDHSTAGMLELMKLRDLFSAFAVAGHHGGLADLGSRMSAESDGTLLGRSRKALTGGLDYKAFASEVDIGAQLKDPRFLSASDKFGMQFFTRMLFSCLVDADFLDTENFMRGGDAVRGDGDEIALLLERLTEYVKPWLQKSSGELNAKRCEILRACMRGGDMPRGLYTLTVPTGGGKTVASLAFSLAHAARHGLRRVIYVIPYTSIIDQNAAVFADILGEKNVLEHHSNVDFAEAADDSEDASEKRRALACENWDAPVVATTAVQFFESLFASRTSRCRKLHNIAGSVIIFDEAQMLPLPYLRPCIAAIAELVKNYGVTAVLCTATQPALDGLFREYAPALPIRELCPDTERYYEFFRRVAFVREKLSGETELAERLSTCAQALCVVNSRKRARRIFRALPEDGRFHLSTYMTPEERKAVIEIIRLRLERGEVCRVVSTSLIEAGVDLDFREVWRERAGLDSVLQAAGRCNREGKRPREESIVHLFTCDERVPDMIAQNVSAAELALSDGADIDALQTIRKYFTTLLKLRGDAVDSQRIMEKCCAFSFKTAAKDFKLIKDDTVPIYIPSEESGGLFDRLRDAGVSRALLRKLSKHAVNVYRYERDALLGAGKLEVTRDGLYILADAEAYDRETGLNCDFENGLGIMI